LPRRGKPWGGGNTGITKHENKQGKSQNCLPGGCGPTKEVQIGLVVWGEQKKITIP